MDQTHPYNGSLTAEQFLFYEIRIAAKYYVSGLKIDEAIERIKKDNLFQYPTERQVSRLARACYKRLDALGNEQLVHELASAPNDIAKQINLYAVMRYKDENALVPFHLFYNTVHTFLESPIRRVIDRCQTAADNHDGLEQQDVSVLKLLYLVRYIEDIKANIDNISILMIDDIRTDKIALRASVSASLERLLSQNYISRNGDTYAFLTDEEQDIAIDIKNTPVDSAQVITSIAQTVYGEIYPSKKFKYGKYDFAYDQYIDETLNGSACGGMRLRIVTVASDYVDGIREKLMKTLEGCDGVQIN